MDNYEKFICKFDCDWYNYNDNNFLFFGLQLFLLYEMRFFILRVKMVNVIKCVIKVIKFYKYVVQSVEKFIFKVSI